MPEPEITYDEWRTAIDAARITTSRNIQLTAEQMRFIDYARAGSLVVGWPTLTKLFNAQFGTLFKHRALDYKYTSQKQQEETP